MSRRARFVEIQSRAAKTSAAPAPLASRLTDFLGGPAEPELILTGLSTAVLGTGSVGGRVAAHFARQRVRALYLADPKRFKNESVLTHEITPCLVGRQKALAVARYCKDISPGTEVFAFAGPVQELPLDALADVDLAVMATDHPLAEREIGQLFVHLGKPLVHAALFGQTLTAQVRTFGNADGQGPCPACQFGHLEWDQIRRDVQYSCEGFQSPRPSRSLREIPSRSTSSLCAFTADLALNQVLRLVLKLGQPVEDTVVDFCGYTNQMVTSPLTRNPGCPCDHRRHILRHAARPLQDCSLRELAEESGQGLGDRPLTFALDELQWAERGTCGCPAPVTLRRFVRPGQRQAGRCRTCGATVLPQPFYCHPAVPSTLLGTALAVPLRKLGATGVRWVLLQDEDRGTLILHPGRTEAQP